MSNRNPITTAPRDGTVIYVYDGDGSTWCLAKWDEGLGYFREAYGSRDAIDWATHWSSLGDVEKQAFTLGMVALAMLVFVLMILRGV